MHFGCLGEVRVQPTAYGEELTHRSRATHSTAAPDWIGSCFCQQVRRTSHTERLFPQTVRCFLVVGGPGTASSEAPCFQCLRLGLVLGAVGIACSGRYPCRGGVGDSTAVPQLRASDPGCGRIRASWCPAPDTKREAR